MQVVQSRCFTRPAAAGRRSLVTVSSANGAGPSPSGPSRPGGGAARFIMASSDEVPSDVDGDVPIVGVRPSGGAFRGVPTSDPGTAGNVGTLSFDRPGGGGTRYNMPASTSVTIAQGPSSAFDQPARFSRPAGGAARMFPNGVGGGGGPTSGDGGSGGSGGGGGSASSGDEPIGLSSLAPWALAYVAVCGSLFAAHKMFIEKPPAPKKKCCGGCGGAKKAAEAKAAAAAETAKGGKSKAK